MTHFGSVNHIARQVASNHRPHTRPVFLIEKTDLRQLRSVVVTWDATSCRHGTDIEMLYGPSSIAFRYTQGVVWAMHKICFYIGFMHVLWYHVPIV